MVFCTCFLIMSSVFEVLASHFFRKNLDSRSAGEASVYS